MDPDERASGIALTVLGFGMGNYKDSTLEALADHGDGNYAYVDTLAEARKVLVEQMTGTLITVARDVKLQLELNPAQVAGYRLIGYENRVLRAQDFNDDRKDAGEIGAGHSVTALYELVPAGQELPAPGVDPLRYQAPAGPGPAAATGELLTVKVRFKPPTGGESRLLSFPVTDPGAKLASASTELRFAAAVAAFGMVLRDSPYRGSSSLALARELAASGRGSDRGGHRAGFEALLQRAEELSR